MRDPLLTDPARPLRPPGASRLELRDVRGRPRHFLDNRPVSDGAVLDLVLADGTCVRGKYDWTGRPDAAPTFVFELATSGDDTTPMERPMLRGELPPDAVLAWPDRG